MSDNLTYTEIAERHERNATKYGGVWLQCNIITVELLHAAGLNPQLNQYFGLLIAERLAYREQHIATLEAELAACKQQAQIHAQEARTANATIAEIYQVCTGGKGEPGNWHGAEPVRRRIAQLEQALSTAVMLLSDHEHEDKRIEEFLSELQKAKG